MSTRKKGFEDGYRNVMKGVLDPSTQLSSNEEYIKGWNEGAKQAREEKEARGEMIKFVKNGKKVMEMKDDGKIHIVDENLKKQMRLVEGVVIEDKKEEGK